MTGNRRLWVLKVLRRSFFQLKHTSPVRPFGSGLPTPFWRFSAFWRLFLQELLGGHREKAVKYLQKEYVREGVLADQLTVLWGGLLVRCAGNPPRKCNRHADCGRFSQLLAVGHCQETAREPLPNPASDAGILQRPVAPIRDAR